jgi:hypothetical protein
MPYLIYTLLALLLSTRIAHASNPVILFTLQSQHIPDQSWFRNFTLCFAPLIAHLFGGVKPPVVIPSRSKSPSWWAYLPHFNPISVIWRWYAIADRRLRACAWDSADMAACNAVFWDSKEARWDGSEDIMLRSRAWIIKVSEQKHAPLLSTSSFTTLVVAVQGAEAGLIIYSFSSRIAAAQIFDGWSLPSLFVPIAIMSLFRLPAALWLSDDYVYWDVSHEGSDSDRNDAEMLVQTIEEADGSLLELGPRTSKRATTTAAVSLLSAGPSQLSQLTTTDTPRVHSTRTRIALAYRIWWLISINGLLVPAAVNAAFTLFHNPRSFPYFSLTSLLALMMYFILSTSAVLITTTYILLGRTHTTIIPCIHAMWYKVLTMVLAAIGLATLIVAALETRQLRDGTVTTLPEFQCNGSAGVCVPVTRGHGNSNI